MAPIAAHHSGGDGVALGIDSLFPHLLGSRSPPAPLWGQLGVIRHYNYSVQRFQTCVPRETSLFLSAINKHGQAHGLFACRHTFTSLTSSFFSSLDSRLPWQKPDDLPVSMGLRVVNVLHPLEF